MKSKLAVWSWILPIISYFAFFLMVYVASITSRELIRILIILFIFGSSIIGFIFGIISLSKMAKDPKLSGKGHAIIGIILSILTFIYGILAIFGSYFGG